MACSPNDNEISVPEPTPVNVPGYGIPTAPIQIPNPSFDLPTDLAEDFASLMQRAGALFPSGLFTPPPTTVSKTIFDFLSKTLTTISPYLSIYNFFLALLRMIKCIIDVLCAIPNPFAVADKLYVLFTQCLPPFLSLFPAFALVSMLISLLLLILELIQYIIELVLSIITDILENLKIFSNALELQDEESILAVTQKIAMLLCFFQNIIAMLLALAAIINIIKAIAQFGGVTFCSDEEDGCCSPEYCPPFIKNTPDGISTTQGKLTYFPEVGVDVQSILGLSEDDAALFVFPAIRVGRYQVFDKNSLPQYKISDIITPGSSNSDDYYWTDTVSMSADMPIKRAQYTVDLKLSVNPADFGIDDDKGLRTFKIKNCIVIEKPYYGVYEYDNSKNESEGVNGTLSIAGGKVFEVSSTGDVPYLIDGVQATLETFIFKDSLLSMPILNDAIIYDDIEFTWKPNVPALAGYNLTTVGCIPSISGEKAILNSIIISQGIEPLINVLPALPDAQAAQQCLLGALDIFRKNISEEGTALFQASVISCLDALKNQTTDVITAAVVTAGSQFKTEYTLDTDVQFVTRPIKVSVVVKDASGTSLVNKLPDVCAQQISEQLSAQVTLGNITSFVYDGAAGFNADLTSNLAGSGEISVLFNSKVISVYTPAANGNPSNISENIKAYTFVDAGVSSPVRRDETDVE